MTTLVVIRENIKNGVLDDVFYPLIIKKRNCIWNDIRL